MLASLANGATGIWCGVSREGAAVGHCCSAVTLANLHRLGNEHVARTYNLPAVRAAAVEVTRITTGRDPPDHEEVYGARAMDVVFDDSGGMGGATQQLEVAAAMGATVRNRVTMFTSPRMFEQRMEQLSPGQSRHLHTSFSFSEPRRPPVDAHSPVARAGEHAEPAHDASTRAPTRTPPITGATALSTVDVSNNRSVLSKPEAAHALPREADVLSKPESNAMVGVTTTVREGCSVVNMVACTHSGSVMECLRDVRF